MSAAAEPASPPPDEPPKETEVEIHKPKPIHDWRELLTEIGVIVIGVAIALAAEQGVEWLHWQGEVTTARTALKTEIAAAASGFYARRVAIAPCLDSKLDRVGAAIADIAAGRQPDLHGLVFNTLGSPLDDSEWQSERSSQVLTHFPREELALMSSFYGRMPDNRDFQFNESIAWGHLSVLQDAGQKLGPADLAQLRANYHLARRFQRLVYNNSVQQVLVAARLGIKVAGFTPAQIADSCNSVASRVKY
jgi:hypothetical protein